MLRRCFVLLTVLLFSGALCLAQSTADTSGVRAGEEKGVARDPSAGHGIESGTDPQGTGVNTGKSTGKGTDHAFMTKAAQGGMAEVELGQLAEQNAQSQDVKDFGKKMVDDHTKANDQLKQVASQEGVTLPTDLDAKDKATKDRLSKLHGEAFDRAYMKDMVTDHKKDVSEFKHESDAGTDPQVKQFATQTLPTLQDHLKMAEEIDSKVGGSAPSPKAASQPKQ